MLDAGRLCKADFVIKGILKKKILIVLGCVLFFAFIPIIDKSLPIVRDIECHRSFFPQERFQKRLGEPPAPWMIEQLTQDFAPFTEKKIQADSVEKTFEQIYQRLKFLPEITHFRILNNKLYKFVPEGAPFSYRDTLTEKMLKTLLLYAKLPDCDFILCGMDGIPEYFVPEDFYLMANPNDQAPILAQAKRESVASNYIVLIPDQFSLCRLWHQDILEVLEANKKISWDQKIPKAVWRGGLTDTGEPTDDRFVPHYNKTPRFLLCQMAFERPESLDAGFAYLDNQEIKALVKERGLWKTPLSKSEHLAYKYLPVLDGRMCTYPGYQWRLLSSSVCLKQESDEVQWFYGALKPYVHYIPVQNDLSDLLKKILWAKEHDEEAKIIADQATKFASENLRFEDVYFYLYLTLSHYAKHQDIDFQKLKKTTTADPHWKCIQYRKRLSLKKSLNKIRSLLKMPG